MSSVLTSVVSESPDGRPDAFFLSPNYPNPFNSETTIRYALPEPGHVRLVIYNALGRKVRTLVDEEQAAGGHSVLWKGKDDLGEIVSTGAYFYRLEVGRRHREAKRMMLLR